jgi:YHS domain-containing protein
MKLKGKKVAKRMLTGIAATVFIGALGATGMAQSNPVTRFDNGYLSGHPEVAQQLANNPSLVDNAQFMSQHPGLREYFANHPEVKEDFKEHPYKFMSREDQLNGWHGNGTPYQQNPGWNGNYQGAAQRFDNGYLRSHPEVAQQLAANPALIDNPQYMNSHPELREYLENHPGIREEIKEHPRRFMSREDQLNGWKHGPYYGPHPYANTDAYLDQNPQLERQLSQNPKLVDNPQFMASHPGLREYLQTHPYARQEWQAHPYKFMKHENQYSKTH